MTVVTPRVARSRKAVLVLLRTATGLVLAAAALGAVYGLPGLVDAVVRLAGDVPALWEELTADRP
ncbi:hypothetical protein GCM10017562_57160 [Streptomyces roseofulvus]|uniref:Histidine kinase n=2 Tax=Streptomyces TaxID=1883 RepID=A0ABU4K9R8_9ACTN|nr:hypothetical protein [Streptomyces roseolus]MDX2294481.1 hypothetical protein [Streptomyces roseolus]